MTTSASPYEVDHLRDRVRLYLQVLLVVDMACHLSSVVLPQPDFPAYFWIPRWGETVLLVAAWAFAKFAKPGRITLIMLESILTVGLGVLYVHLASSVVQLDPVMVAHGPGFALLGILLALVLRAALVPSSVIRTVVIGIATIAYLLVHVSIYDYGRTPDGQFYYAMEYLDGVNLEQLVDIDGAVPAARVAQILRQAARALAEAHALGLVHRDIKPANIMLCERAQVPDTVKMLDFGLVKAIDNPDADSNITHENTVIGTPHYLALEGISEPDDVGPPSDVYALGAVASYLLTGREVFTGKTVIEVCSRHLNTAPEAPSEVLGDPIDPDFEALILRCLAKKPDDRPGDGAALADELDELEVPGWGTADARAWWSDPSKRTGVGGRQPSERTQLKINVEGRR